MSKKTNLEIKKALDRLANPSIFDRIVKEMDTKQVPVKYIDYVLITFNAGHSIQLSGYELRTSYPSKEKASWEQITQAFKNVKDIQIFVDVEKLERDVTSWMNQILEGKE